MVKSDLMQCKASPISLNTKQMPGTAMLTVDVLKILPPRHHLSKGVKGNLQRGIAENKLQAVLMLPVHLLWINLRQLEVAKVTQQVDVLIL